MGIEAVVGFNCKNNHSISSLMILKSSNDINTLSSPGEGD